eukprot:GILI01004846.1.p1 GENE.GILI01004846.1~~GILI01004846.1.p1  ORF type:complete len:411 (+),score=163.15 GILI01004846.1:51-1235(+)
MERPEPTNGTPAKKAKIISGPGIAEPRTVGIIGAPLSEGQSLQGVDLAPNALRAGGLKNAIEELNWHSDDVGDLELKFESEEGEGDHMANMGKYKKWKETNMMKRFSVWFSNEDLDEEAEREAAAAGTNPATAPSSEVTVYKNVKNSEAIGHACHLIHQECKRQAQLGKFVLTIGGDHSIAAGTISGVAAARPDLCVIWVDAHGDCNTPETSPSGNYHGMPVAHLLGWIKQGSIPGFDWLSPCIPEERIAIIGIRDLDPLERKMLRESKVKAFSMSEIDRHGIGKVMEMALKAVNPNNDRPIHISFDIDAIDPVHAPGTGTKARGGLSYREAHFICESVAETGMLGSMDVVEVNPILDAPEGEQLHGDNPTIHGTPTVALAIELISSALGKTIL